MSHRIVVLWIEGVQWEPAVPGQWGMPSDD